jgi:hypothetical protein
MRAPIRQGDPIRKAFSYDHDHQVAVDRNGIPLIMAAPSAKSVTSGDGDEGPSEDWVNDFVHDSPYSV